MFRGSRKKASVLVTRPLGTGMFASSGGRGTGTMSFLERAGGKGKMSVGMFFQAYATNLHDCFLEYGVRAAEK